MVVDILELVDLVRLVYDLVTPLEVHEAVTRLGQGQFLRIVSRVGLIPFLLLSCIWILLFLRQRLILLGKGILKVNQEVAHHRVHGWCDLRERAVNVMAFLFGVLVRPVVVEIVLEDFAMLVVGLDFLLLLFVSNICTVLARALLR